MASFPFDIVGFDLDGTLADTAPDLTAALNHALVTLGRDPVPAPSVRSMVGHGARALLAKGITATGEFREELVDQGLPIFLQYYEAHIADDSHPFPGVVDALDALAARGVRLAICTNKLEHLARRFVTAIGWDGRFAAIVGGDTTPSAKPNPEPLLHMIEQAGGGRCAFVGDSISDTGAAIAANLPCVALTFGFTDRPPGELGADALIDHFDQLIPTLERLGG
jgi:phosphoglycolate phosphatase